MFIHLVRSVLLFSIVSCGSSGVESSSDVKAAGTCLEMRTENQCVSRFVCHVVCDAAGGAAGASVGGAMGSAGIGAATSVCNQICEYVPECTPVSVCSRWGHDPY
jgi:hypothetical protein